jgi:hypothetical protein
MDQYNQSKIKFFSPMIDTIGQTSNIFNRWIDTFSVKHDLVSILRLIDSN